MRFAITGATGFIGMHLAEYLLNGGHDVVYACDSLEPIYGGNLAKLRHEVLIKSSIVVEQVDLSDVSPFELAARFKEADTVIHLAANAGVRQSILSPHSYSRSNLTAFSNVLEAIRLAECRKFMFASSSSVYGKSGTSSDQREEDANGKNLASYYAATKWANEILARTYAENFDIGIVGLRFFTVYGSYGRPDMAYWTFAEKILKNEEVELYGEDGGRRSFSHVSNIVDLISRLAESRSLHEHLSLPGKRFTALNLGNTESQTTLSMLNGLSDSLDRPARIKRVARPVFDVDFTKANMDKTSSFISNVPFLSLSEGLKEFADWYRVYSRGLFQ